MMDGMAALGRNVVCKRAERRISQAELARRATVARQTVSKIESGYGDVRVGVLEKIATVLGCDVRDLFAPQPHEASVAEIRRRSKASDKEFVDADVLLDAIDEANRTRYSKAGRPRSLARNIPPRSR